MADNNTEGLGTMLSFLSQGQGAGIPQMQAPPNMQLPDTSVNMPQRQSGILGGILGNVASSYIAHKFKSYQDKQDAKEAGSALSEAIGTHMESLPKDSAMRSHLGYMQKLANSDSPTNVKAAAAYYQDINQAAAKNEEQTSLQKELTGNSPSAAYKVRQYQQMGSPVGTTRNEEGGLTELKYTPTKGGYNQAKAELSKEVKSAAPGTNPETLALAQQREARLAEADKRKETIDTLKESSNEFKNKSTEWKLANPTYPKDQAEIRQSELDHQALVKSVDNYKTVLEKYGQAARHNPLANAALQTAYQSVTWPARSKNMLNTGVMNVGEYPMLNAIVSNPTEFTPQGFRSKDELNKQLDEFINVSKQHNDMLKNKLAPTELPPKRDSSSNEDLNPYVPKPEGNNLVNKQSTGSLEQWMQEGKLPKDAPAGAMYKDAIMTDKGWTQVKPGDKVVINGKTGTIK